MRAHSNNRPHRCHVCGYRFKVRSVMVDHIAVKHSGLIHILMPKCINFLTYFFNLGDGDYVCVVCSKVFNRARLLRTHMLSHSEERPFVCPIESCGKAFKYNRNLKVHNKVHTGEKSHCCFVCGQDFTHLTSWQNHMTKYHPEVKIPRGRQTGVQPETNATSETETKSTSQSTEELKNC